MTEHAEPTLFERIAAREIPAQIVAETDRVIAFHDIGDWEGVTRFYQELLRTSTEFVEVVNVAGLCVVKRIAPPSGVSPA